MPSLNLKKSRPKSYEEKLQERQERMNYVDRQETIFMPGDNLSDNEDDAPFEVETKREVLPLIEEEPTLPDIVIKPRKLAKQKKQLKHIGDGEFAVKVDNKIQFKIQAPVEIDRKTKNKMSFREQLLLANTKHKRRRVKGNPKHVDKWANKKIKSSS